MKFGSVSTILPTSKERDSFVKVIKMILGMNRHADIKEFIAVVCERTRLECYQSIEKSRNVAREMEVPLKALRQTTPGFSGAIRDGFMETIESLVRMMTLDLDTLSDKLPGMFALAKQQFGGHHIPLTEEKGRRRISS